jgi:hypothetical protein
MQPQNRSGRLPKKKVDRRNLTVSRIQLESGDDDEEEDGNTDSDGRCDI